MTAQKIKELCTIQLLTFCKEAKGLLDKQDWKKDCMIIYNKTSEQILSIFVQSSEQIHPQSVQTSENINQLIR